MFDPEDIEIGNPSFFQLDPEQVKDLKYVVKNYQPGDNLVLQWRKLSGPVWALVRPARSGKSPRAKELLDDIFGSNRYNSQTGRWIGPDPEPQKYVETWDAGGGMTGVISHFGHTWGEDCTSHCLRKSN